MLGGIPPVFISTQASADCPPSSKPQMTREVRKRLIADHKETANWHHAAHEATLHPGISAGEKPPNRLKGSH